MPWKVVIAGYIAAVAMSNCTKQVILQQKNKAVKTLQQRLRRGLGNEGPLLFCMHQLSLHKPGQVCHIINTLQGSWQANQ